MHSFSDCLTAAIRAKRTALCVGIDPRIESLPKRLLHYHGSDGAAAVEEFCLRVLDIIAPITPVVKPQSAFFEALGPAGFQALHHILRRAKELGLVTILDAKRGDIASTAEAYATAAFDQFDADALTVNPYLGRDAIEPFLNRARKDGRGLFVLVRTSNPGAGLFQDLNCEGKPLYQHVAAAVREWNAGRGDVGAIVGATHPSELKLLRQLLPDEWFLIPGYGTQGGTADDVRGGFRGDGLGAIVNSSRGVTFPFQPDDPDWDAAIEKAARQAAAELRVGVPASAG
jgi:orotidine-5'-phosphate decarboxylase